MEFCDKKYGVWRKNKKKGNEEKRIKNHGRKSDRENYSGVTNGREKY